MTKVITRPLTDSLGNEVGTYTLTPIPAEWPGHEAYLVSVDEAAARFYGGPSFAGLYAGSILGSLTKVGAGWAVVAYQDRDAYTRGEEPCWGAPVDVRNHPQGVRILLHYWRIVHRGQDVDRITVESCANL